MAYFEVSADSCQDGDYSKALVHNSPQELKKGTNFMVDIKIV